MSANYKVTRYPHGTFSWADATVPDVTSNKAFYANVLGWHANDIPLPDNQGVYTMYQVDGLNVAGMGETPANMPIPPHWMCYVNVDNVDALVVRAEEMGAQIPMPAMDVMNEGRMALIQDPTGATIGLWQSKEHIGAQLVNTHGAMSWNDLMTNDVEKAKVFYRELFDWEFMDGGDDYVMIMNNGRMNGGIFKQSEAQKHLPPSWTTYFTVSNIDEAIEKVTAHGGTVHMPIQIMSSGKMGFVSDPNGAFFALFSGDKLDAWEE